MSPSDQPGAKKWAIGVELAPDHLGPVCFAASLAEHVPEDLIVGLHVLPNAALLHPLLGRGEAKQLREAARDNVAELMIKRGLAHERTRVELVEDDAVEQGLSEGAERLGVDALLVGRRARRDDDPIIRLGEVTRRLLRRLPVPVIVVPPDFGDANDRGLGEGPVICGVDLSEHCKPALRFAAGLAARLGRPLLLAHGTQTFSWGVSYVPPATMERLQTQTREVADGELSTWLEGLEFELGEHRQEVFMGDPARQLLQLAVDEDAALIVTGSRLLGPVERLFIASVGTEVAAAASCPVAVVPGS